MDEKVLKIVTPIIALLTVVFFATFRFMPAIHERYALVVEKREKLFESWDAYTVVQENLDEILVEAEGQDTQLNIEIPADVGEESLSIENDYLTQSVYVRFPGGADDYFSDYGISGSSDHIKSLFYYKDGDDGVIELNLDHVYEIRTEVTEGNVAMEFIDPHELYDKVVVVDVGHGSRAAGATKKGIMEKEINLQIALQLKKIFDESEENIKVYYTRTEDTNPTFKQRVDLANLSDADLFISIHNNSSQSGNFTSLSGTQVLYSQSDDSEYSSKRLAQICLDSVTDATGSNKRGLMKGDDIYIIRSSEVPVALIEVGFMTNREELDNLISEEYQCKAAQGIYNAVLAAFEEGY